MVSRIFAFLVGLACCAPSWASDIHVSATGAGLADGTSTSNAYAGLSTAMSHVSAGDRLCLHGTFKGTADRQVSGVMLRPQVSGTSDGDTVYEGDCDGIGIKAVLDCDSVASSIGIRAYNGSAQSTYIKVRNVIAKNCKNKIVVTYNTTADATNPAHQTYEHIELYNANGGGSGANCFDNRGRYLTVRDIIMDGCDEDGIYSQGKYPHFFGVDVKNVSRATTGGDGLQLAGESDGYIIDDIDCDKTNKDSKQCVIVSALTDTGANGRFSNFRLRCFEGATVQYCAFITGAGASVRSGWTTGGLYGLALEGSANSTNILVQGVAAMRATNHGVAVFSGAGTGNQIVNSGASANGAHGFINASSNPVTFRNDVALGNGSCGINKGSASDTESHNNSYGNGVDWCSGGVSTTAGAGSLSSVPGLAGGSVPDTAEGFCPVDGSVLVAAGEWSGGCFSDVRGHGFGNPPNIGPMTSCRARASAASRPSRTAN